MIQCLGGSELQSEYKEKHEDAKGKLESNIQNYIHFASPVFMGSICRPAK